MTREEKISVLKDIINGEIINPLVRKDIGEWAIKALEQQPKIGRWIEEFSGHLNKAYYKCSECGNELLTSNINAYRYCNLCGAKMEGVEESESCKGCPNICVMYDTDMKGCKDKMEGG